MSEISTAHELQVHVDTVLASMKSVAVVDQGGYEEAAAFLKTVKESARFVETFYASDLQSAQELKRAAEAERKKIDDMIKRFTTPLSKAEAIIKKAMSDYLQVQEQKRRAIEDQRRREEQERRLAEAIETGKEEILDAPVKVQRAPEPPKVEGTHSVEVWCFEIVDKTKINPGFLVPDEKLIRAVVQASKQGAQEILGAGVRVYAEKQIRVRL